MSTCCMFNLYSRVLYIVKLDWWSQSMYPICYLCILQALLYLNGNIPCTHLATVLESLRLVNHLGAISLQFLFARNTRHTFYMRHTFYCMNYVQTCMSINYNKLNTFPTKVVTTVWLAPTDLLAISCELITNLSSHYLANRAASKFNHSASDSYTACKKSRKHYFVNW